ncbi:MAG: hypothetical protein AB1646_11770 [Thermodesulfobacteriota bacterium]
MTPQKLTSNSMWGNSGLGGGNIFGGPAFTNSPYGGSPWGGSAYGGSAYGSGSRPGGGYGNPQGIYGNPGARKPWNQGLADLASGWEPISPEDNQARQTLSRWGYQGPLPAGAGSWSEAMKWFSTPSSRKSREANAQASFDQGTKNFGEMMGMSADLSSLRQAIGQAGNDFFDRFIPSVASGSDWKTAGFRNPWVP